MKKKMNDTINETINDLQSDNNYRVTLLLKESLLQLLPSRNKDILTRKDQYLI